MRTAVPLLIAWIVSGCVMDTGGECVAPTYDNAPICEAMVEYYGCLTFEGMTHDEFRSFCLSEEGDSATTDTVDGVRCWTCD